MPAAFDSVAAEPPVVDTILARFPAEPLVVNVLVMVWVVPEVSFSPLVRAALFTFRVAKVLAPEIITLSPVIVRVLKVLPPPVRVLDVADVLLMTRTELSALRVRFVVVPVFQTVSVPVNVHVPLPILITLESLLELVNPELEVMFLSFASNVPFCQVKELLRVMSSCKV